MNFYLITATRTKSRRAAHTRSVCSTCRGLAIEPSRHGLARPTARERGPGQRAQAAHEAARSRTARARAGAAPAHGSHMERGPWYSCQQVKVDRLSIRSYRRRPLDISDPAWQGFEDQLEQDSDGNERAVLTDGNAISSQELRHTLAKVGGMASPRREGAPGPAHEDGRQVRWLSTDGAAVAAYRREAAIGAQTTCKEGVAFIHARMERG
jgi:hypothetical protein